MVLAAYSEPLAARSQDYAPGAEINLDFRDFSRDTVLSVLTFIYTTDINITEDTVGELVHCTLEMEVSGVYD